MSDVGLTRDEALSRTRDAEARAPKPMRSGCLVPRQRCNSCGVWFKTVEMTRCVEDERGVFYCAGCLAP